MRLGRAGKDPPGIGCGVCRPQTKKARTGHAPQAEDRHPLDPRRQAQAIDQAGVDRQVRGAELVRLGQPLGDLGREMVERQVAKRWAVVVEPVKVATWDHRKMADGS